MSEPEEIDGAAINLNFLSSERSGEGKIETVRGAAVYISGLARGLAGRINRLGSLSSALFSYLPATVHLLKPIQHVQKLSRSDIRILLFVDALAFKTDHHCISRRLVVRMHCLLDKICNS